MPSTQKRVESPIRMPAMTNNPTSLGWIGLGVVGAFVIFALLRRVSADGRVGGWPVWLIRGVVWCAFLAFFMPALWGYMSFKRATAADEAGARGPATVPCRFVGEWTSTRDNTSNRITLSDDGRYAMDSYTGSWSVRGRDMVWQHDQGPVHDGDINRILPESPTRFTLIEVNGSRTKFERVGALPTEKCKP